MKIKMLFLAGILLAVATMVFTKTLEAGDFPKRVGYVNDFADVFSPEESLVLEDKIQEFYKKTRIEIIVVTMKSLEEGKRPNEYLQELSEDWKTGDRSILLLMVPERERGGAAINLGSEIKQNFNPVVAWQAVYKDMFPGAMVGQANEGIVKAVQRIIQYYTEKLGRAL
ncbi:MAG: TPM domain-containing protein [Patescibacteria group bacterium]